MQRLAAESIPVLIAPDSGLRTKPRPGWNGGYYAFMRRVLSTELYKQRQHLIERSLARSNTSAAVTAFTDEAEPPSEPNGA